MFNSMWFHIRERGKKSRIKINLSFYYCAVNCHFDWRKKNTQNETHLFFLTLEVGGLFCPYSILWGHDVSIMFQIFCIAEQASKYIWAILWLYQIIVDISAISAPKVKTAVEKITINHFNIRNVVETERIEFSQQTHQQHQ